MTLLDRYQKRLRTDKRLNAIRGKIRVSTNYGDVDDYAARSGEILSDELIYEVQKTGTFSDASKEVMWDALQEQYELVTEGAEVVQGNMNAANDIGLGIKRADFDAERTSRLVNEYAEAGNKPAMNEAIIAYAQSYVDNTVRQNMDAHARAGFKPKLIREAEAPQTKTRLIEGKHRTYKYNYIVPCNWCASLAGTYDYSQVRSGDAVFRRHKGCRCKVTFVENRTAQDVWSKIEWDYGNAEAQAQAVRQKEQQKQWEAMRKEVERQTKANIVDILVNKYKMSAKSASIFYNIHKDEIAKYGIEHLL